VAVETTPRGYKIPDGTTELVKRGAEVIGDNARKADADVTALQAQLAAATTRLGQAEANISAGMGGGPGLTEDPLNRGTYFMADDSPIDEDPDNPGLYTF
jgi:outer membrane protein TolC